MRKLAPRDRIWRPPEQKMAPPRTKMAPPRQCAPPRSAILDPPLPQPLIRVKSPEIGKIRRHVDYHYYPYPARASVKLHPTRNSPPKSTYSLMITSQTKNIAPFSDLSFLTQTILPALFDRRCLIRRHVLRSAKVHFLALATPNLFTTDCQINYVARELTTEVVLVL